MACWASGPLGPPVPLHTPRARPGVPTCPRVTLNCQHVPSVSLRQVTCLPAAGAAQGEASSWQPGALALPIDASCGPVFAFEAIPASTHVSGRPECLQEETNLTLNGAGGAATAG